MAETKARSWEGKGRRESRFTIMGKEELKEECKLKHLPVVENLMDLRTRLERATCGQATLSWCKRPRAEGGGGADQSGRGKEGEIGDKGAEWEARGSKPGSKEAETGNSLGNNR